MQAIRGRYRIEVLLRSPTIPKRVLATARHFFMDVIDPPTLFQFSSCALGEFRDDVDAFKAELGTLNAPEPVNAIGGFRTVTSHVFEYTHTPHLLLHRMSITFPLNWVILYSPCGCVLFYL